jgi:oligoribonuclease
MPIDKPLVWIDLEMSGLSLKTEYILEIACIITDAELNIIAESPNLIINHPQSLMDSMNDWCKKTHSESGLVSAVLSSKISMKDAENQILSFIKEHIPQEKIAILAGNSIHVDKQFLFKDMPSIVEHLHYRLLDVSTVKELCSRWYPEQFKCAPVKSCTHRALDDIKESISELKYYRSAIFLKK